jgi:predicted nucleic acid-binding protein
MYLVDSSVWVDVLRDRTGARARRFRSVLDPRDVVLSRFTQMELLQGARDQREWNLLSRTLDTQQFLEPTPTTWSNAARIFFELRRKGLTIRSAIDCCIAQTALENEVVLVHRDRDFETIATLCPLHQVWLEWGE